MFLVVAWGLIALLIVAACGDNHTEQASARIDISVERAQPGDVIQVRILAPDADRYEYGRLATLESRGNNGEWIPTHHLRMSEDAAGAASAPYDGDLDVLGDAHSDDREWHVRVPDVIEPGRYRVSIIVRIGPTADPRRVTAVSDILDIAKRQSDINEGS